MEETSLFFLLRSRVPEEAFPLPGEGGGIRDP